MTDQVLRRDSLNMLLVEDSVKCSRHPEREFIIRKSVLSRRFFRFCQLKKHSLKKQSARKETHS